VADDQGRRRQMENRQRDAAEALGKSFDIVDAVGEL
jgi:hypothetical protein